eukprot:c6053_g1_i1.p1 GENE.c6053_g1_i1~~c6053_g1_i1.p1  ORF type:complete len:303 (-),score=67.17 c6053_g1_i1:69-926(-)
MESQDKPMQTKIFWSPEEDKLLQHLVETLGPRNWSLLAKSFTNRIGKQCRERWHNHLNPQVRKDAWTEYEDQIILQQVQLIGTKWAAISQHLPGRTDSSIKNRYHSHLKRFTVQAENSNQTNRNSPESAATPPRPHKVRRLSSDSDQIVSATVDLSHLVDLVPSTAMSASSSASASQIPIFNVLATEASRPVISATINSKELRELLNQAATTDKKQMRCLIRLFSPTDLPCESISRFEPEIPTFRSTDSASECSAMQVTPRTFSDSSDSDNDDINDDIDVDDVDW